MVFIVNSSPIYFATYLLSLSALRVSLSLYSASCIESRPPCRQEGAVSAFRKTYDKTVSLGQRLDIVFHLIRIGLFYMDNDLITRNIDKAKRSV